MKCGEDVLLPNAGQIAQLHNGERYLGVFLLLAVLALRRNWAPFFVDNVEQSFQNGLKPIGSIGKLKSKNNVFSPRNKINEPVQDRRVAFLKNYI